MMLCQLCESEDAHNFHHFVPRTLHSNKWFKKRYTRAQMQAGIDVCKASLPRSVSTRFSTRSGWSTSNLAMK